MSQSEQGPGRRRARLVSLVPNSGLQFFDATFIFRTFQGNQLVKEEIEPLKLSYYTYPHLRALFLLADLEPMEEYGSFLQTPLDNSSTDMIFIVKATPAKITAGTDYFRSGGSVHGLKRE